MTDLALDLRPLVSTDVAVTFDANSDPAEQAAIATVLIDAGFTTTDAWTWATGWTCRPTPTSIVLNEATRFDDAGVTAAAALGWHQAGFYANHALAWIRRGFTLDQTCEALDHDDDADDWLATNLTADVVLAHLRAGVAAWEYDPNNPFPLDALRTLAGMRGR